MNFPDSKPQRGDMFIETPNPHTPKPQRADMCMVGFQDGFFILIDTQ